MDLSKLKQHIRVEHDFEDDLLTEYKKWSEAEIKDSVSTSENRNDDYFKSNVHFEKAVALLTGHYYENRLPMTDLNLNNVPFGINSAIHKLRGGYYESSE